MEREIKAACLTSKMRSEKASIKWDWKEDAVLQRRSPAHHVGCRANTPTEINFEDTPPFSLQLTLHQLASTGPCPTHQESFFLSPLGPGNTVLPKAHSIPEFSHLLLFPASFTLSSHPFPCILAALKEKNRLKMSIKIFSNLICFKNQKEL